ncbi:hypothetical protein CV693_04580 [Borreliella burgdorferi]|nr:hypothetical protein CV693_04580 [Borreliella burgdorferi]
MQLKIIDQTTTFVGLFGLTIQMLILQCRKQILSSSTSIQKLKEIKVKAINPKDLKFKKYCNKH